MSDIDNEFVSVPEAARRLGVTPAYLYKLISDGKITPFRRPINNRVVVSWPQVREKFQPKPVEDESESE